MSLPQPGSPRWRVTHSLWILPTFLLGLLTWGSFFYIGIRTGKRAWLITGGVYLLLVIGCFVAMGFSGPTTDELAAGAPPRTHSEEIVNTWLSGALVANWIAGFVHALLVRPQYLHLLWEKSAGPQHAITPVYPDRIQPRSANGWIGGDPQQYWAPQAPSVPAPWSTPAVPAPGLPAISPQATPASTPGSPGAPWQTAATPTWGASAEPWSAAPPPGSSGAPNAGQSVPATSPWQRIPSTPAEGGRLAPLSAPGSAPQFGLPAAASESARSGTHRPASDSDATSDLATDRIDVNTCSAEQLAQAGLPRSAVDAVLEARKSTAPLRDLREFARVTGLKPHELHLVAARLSFSETPTPAARGRKLDL
ncbi:helix-hairpin-helix domain-containing protein [Nocardia sp. NBC_01377]|uniref:helix-hairpin-helix domain-containing protein n=1 Tax=Nocardia sp. NBC_01377 TaxID=2903595 RepID=UPI00324F5D72